MKIVNGGTRIVILIGPFAIKIAKMDFSIRRLGFIYKYLRGRIKPNEKRVLNVWIVLGDLIAGIFENWSERKNWKKNKASFMAPTYFSLGIVNLQKRIKGKYLSDEERIGLWQKVCEATNNEAERTYSHHLSGFDNLIVTANGVVLVDYGDSLPGDFEIALCGFLKKHRRVLEEIFSRI
ncbi:MAG: hypothetical protein WC242_01710 [Candidatus Paceibacterota bacterium]|jgi:hypothetical protein